MEINRDLLAPCGLYCGVCAIRIADLADNDKFKSRLVGLYKGKLPGADELTVDDIHCNGCLSDQPFGYCVTCAIKDCNRAKGQEGCHQCDDFPCGLIDDFPMPVGKRVILRAIPHWRAVGTEQYVADEIARYSCPGCGKSLFRGAKRCNSCGQGVDMD